MKNLSLNMVNFKLSIKLIPLKIYSYKVKLKNFNIRYHQLQIVFHWRKNIESWRKFLIIGRKRIVFCWKKRRRRYSLITMVEVFWKARFGSWRIVLISSKVRRRFLKISLAVLVVIKLTVWNLSRKWLKNTHSKSKNLKNINNKSKNLKKTTKLINLIMNKKHLTPNHSPRPNR